MKCKVLIMFTCQERDLNPRDGRCHGSGVRPPDNYANESTNHSNTIFMFRSILEFLNYFPQQSNHSHNYYLYLSLLNDRLSLNLFKWYILHFVLTFKLFVLILGFDEKTTRKPQNHQNLGRGVVKGKTLWKRIKKAVS